MVSVNRIVFDFTIVAAPAMYTSRLAYLQAHTEKCDRLLKRHKPGTPAHDVYKKAYSLRNLLVWLLFTLGLGANLLVDTYKGTHAHPSPYIVGPAEVCELILLLSGACLGRSSFRGLGNRNSGNHSKDDWLT